MNRLKWLPLLLWLFLFLGGEVVLAAAQPYFKLQGSFAVPKDTDAEKLSKKTVVLLMFTMDEQGAMQTSGPIARTTTDEEGKYSFEQVPLNQTAAYRLGSRWNGELISSELLFMKAGQTEAKLDIRIPRILSDQTQTLKIQDHSVFLEPAIGALVVTEALSIVNPLKDMVQTQKQALMFTLPEDASDVRVVHGPKASEGSVHDAINHQFLVKADFNSGANPLIFQYQLPATWGRMSFDKVWHSSTEQAFVLTPPGALKVQSPHLELSEARVLGNKTFLSWKVSNLGSPQTALHVKEIQVSQKVYAYLATVPALLLSMLLIWYWRQRLRNSSSS